MKNMRKTLPENRKISSPAVEADTISQSEESSRKQSKEKDLKQVEKDLNSSDLQKDADSSDIKSTNKELDDFQLNFISKLPSAIRTEVHEKHVKKMIFRLETNDKIDKLDIDSPSTELKEMDLEAAVIKNDIEITKYVANVLDNSNVPMSDADRSTHSSLYSAQTDQIAKYIVAVEEHKANIKRKLEILARPDDSDNDDNNGGNNSGSNNPGNGGAGGGGSNNPGSGDTDNSNDAGNNNRSLIDDFADISTEMPSYMDPED